MRRIVIWMPACAVASAVLAGACGGSSGGDATKGAVERAAPASTTASTSAATSDPCALLSAGEIAQQVKNPVQAGTPQMGSGVCKWDTENPDLVSVLLQAHPRGSMREQVLCPDLRKAAAAADGLDGVGEAATWKFSRMGTMFNSGDLEACGPRGFVSLSLNGKQDEAALKAAATALATLVLQRLR